jgi:ABC-type cobalamin/Fe3+-siderophores transport system ATPase subunit
VTIVSIKGLTKRYGQNLAVDHLNLDAREGEILGILGPNGAGKSSTLLMLSTIIKPTEGTAKVGEENIHHGWEKLLPLWRKKEPFIDNFVKMRYALPLFWERSIIEINPTKLYLWPNGDTDKPPQVFEVL